MMAGETVSLVRAAVQRLPASQRLVVELAYFEGLTYERSRTPPGSREAPPNRGSGWHWPSWKKCWTVSCWNPHDRRRP